jgi:adenine-specific DNA-methyltransferase
MGMKTNVLYYGDNLRVLRKLAKEDEGQIRLVYIDPPFGTGQSFTSSNDRHSTISRSSDGDTAYHDLTTGKAYLDFLRPRLRLIQKLLANDGSIYVHIDCKVGHYVKILLDRIFDPKNFRSDITRIKCNPKNFKRYGYGNMKDMILFYTKSGKCVWNYPRQPYSQMDLLRLFPKIDEDGRRYTTVPIHAPGETVNGASGKSWNGVKPPVGRHWRCGPAELTVLDQKGLIEWSSKGNPRKKVYADEASKIGKYMQDVWVFKDPQYPKYPTEKNLDMLKLIIQASSNEGDIVMDCFCGSGSTLLAAQQTNRQWIGIDNSEPAIEICRERLNAKDVIVL